MDATAAFEQRFRNALSRHTRLEPRSEVLVGVSGGRDSVVLLHLLQSTGLNCRVAHLNYRLRGEESDADEQFVTDLCSEIGVECHVERLDDAWPSTRSGESLQAEARRLRYDFFHRLAVSEGVEAVAVGHHEDDQIETVLLRLFRGSGLEGLTGMAYERPLERESSVRLIRPLLFASRAEITDYAAARDLHYRDDSSNLESRYDRNRLRESVVPVIEDTFGRAALRNLVRSARQARGLVAHTLRPKLTEDFAAATRTSADGRVGLDIQTLNEHPESWRNRLILEAIKRWLPDLPRRASIVRAVRSLIDSQRGRKAVFAGGTVWRTRTRLVFTTVEPDVSRDDPVSVEVGEPVCIAGGKLLVEPGAKTGSSRTDPNVEYVHDGVLEKPLTAGRWQPGERFQPVGMKGTKKISDFLSECGVPLYSRSAAHVLRSGDRVVWVIGHRLDDRFKLGPEAETSVRLSFHPDHS